MFDALKKGLQKFKGAFAEEAEKEAEKAPPAPAAKATPPAAAKPAPKAAPAPKPVPAADLEEERGLSDAEIDAMLDAELDNEPPAPPVKAVAPPPSRAATRPDGPKAQAAARFDREISRVVTPPPGTPPEHDIQGAEEEEGDRTKVPAPPAALQSAPGPAHGPAITVPEYKAPAPGKGKGIDPARVQDLLFDLEVSLLEADVALATVEAIRRELERSLPQIRVERTDDVPAAVETSLRAAIHKVLDVGRVDFDEFVLAQPKPVVVMFVGVNGTGKTTAIGRVAHRLKENAIGCVMAAGDTFRAGAIEQLERHGQNLGITVIKTQAGGDPAAVAYDAIEHAKARKKDVVLLDTAGRMQTNTNLMDEMKKIKRVAKPAMIVFVGDSLAGNDAVEQAVQFDKAVGLDAVILTKVDTDAKGGAALSIAHAVGKPVLFLGVGQEYGDLIPYDPKWMIQRIFD